VRIVPNIKTCLDHESRPAEVNLNLAGAADAETLHRVDAASRPSEHTPATVLQINPMDFAWLSDHRLQPSPTRFRIAL
jgi:hypothetical protein